LRHPLVFERPLSAICNLFRAQHADRFRSREERKAAVFVSERQATHAILDYWTLAGDPVGSARNDQGSTVTFDRCHQNVRILQNVFWARIQNGARTPRPARWCSFPSTDKPLATEEPGLKASAATTGIGIITCPAAF
jgi:hypothetical protein